MKRLLFLLIPATLLGFGSQALAQNKARVTIRIEQNGETREEVRELEVQDGEDIETILQEMGLLNEFGELKPGQRFEINIQKSGDQIDEQELNMLFAPTPPMPPMPPLPPMEPGEPQPFLGVKLLPDGAPGVEGAYVSEVVEGTAAEASGLEAGDIITRINNEDITDIEDLMSTIQQFEPGENIRVTYLRDGKKKNTKATLGTKESEVMMWYGDEFPPMAPDAPDDLFPYQDFNFRFNPDSITIICPDGIKIECDSFRICQPFSWEGEGFELKETAFLGITPGEENGEPGVPVGTVIAGSAAETMGLEPGDVIISFNGTDIQEFDQLAELIGAQEPGATVTINYRRDNKERTTTGNLGKRAISGRDDFRIFHDFKGMDEDGNYFYDFEFDMDAEDIEGRMEELMLLLEEQQLRIEEEKERLSSELDRLRSERESVTITIDVVDISREEADLVNTKANPKLALDNNLNLSAISFFPNPTDGIINLKFSSPEKGELTVMVYDSSGNKVYLEMAQSFSGEYSNTIDLAEQPNGSYYLQILVNGKSYSKKIIKGN